MSIAIEPIRVVDRNTAARIINTVIMKYYIEYNGYKYWADDAVEELYENYLIKISKAGIRQFLVNLKKGTRDSRAASYFNGKISTRVEKDGMYREFDALIDFVLCGRQKNYVGLPANQIIYVARKYDSVVACERDRVMFVFMSGLQQHFVPNENVSLVHEDIVEYLQKGVQKFSIFDIDLMTHVNSPKILDRLANGISKSFDSRAAICLVTCCGRKISESEYTKIMPYTFIAKLDNLGVRVKYSKSGEYVDQIIPMKYEFLVVEND